MTSASKVALFNLLACHRASRFVRPATTPHRVTKYITGSTQTSFLLGHNTVRGEHLYGTVSTHEGRGKGAGRDSGRSRTRNKPHLLRNIGIICVSLTASAGYQMWKYNHSQAGCYVESGDLELSRTKLQMYSVLPLNSLSRLWGWVNNLTLPVFLRTPVIGLYAWAFGCNLEEASNSDLRSYANLQQFFTRSLKPGCRPVDTTHSLTSPSDGTIVDCGRVSGDRVEQIKGATYSLRLFLGPQSFTQNLGSCDDLSENAWGSEADYRLLRSNTALYQCVVYLAPGDYHRFHSPTDWTVTLRRHFPGFLLSVNPSLTPRVPDLFSIQERVVYIGRWRHGFFSMALVGANNVGSISVNSDQDLLTNTRKCVDCPKEFVPPEPLQCVKGGEFGHFNLGSTIVLIFEAPSQYSFTVQPGQTIKYGQPLAL